MRYIETLHEGETIRNTYLCKGKEVRRQGTENHMTT